jgi:hypothetical protein
VGGGDGWDTWYASVFGSGAGAGGDNSPGGLGWGFVPTTGWGFDGTTSGSPQGGTGISFNFSNPFLIGGSGGSIPTGSGSGGGFDLGQVLGAGAGVLGGVIAGTGAATGAGKPLPGQSQVSSGLLGWFDWGRIAAILLGLLLIAGGMYLIKPVQQVVNKGVKYSTAGIAA